MCNEIEIQTSYNLIELPETNLIELSDEFNLVEIC